jgi:hypothetical protein
MKIVTVVPSPNTKPSLKILLRQTEKRLRDRGTTLIREREGRWVHKKYPGWINWDLTKGGFVVAEVGSKKPNTEWQLLQSFIGYLDRHLGQVIESISITYR